MLNERCKIAFLELYNEYYTLEIIDNDKKVQVNKLYSNNDFVNNILDKATDFYIISKI